MSTRRPGRVLAMLLAWSVILGSLAALAVGVVLPRIAGATTYTVLSGSMRPGIEPGDLVVVREVPVEEIGMGSVVTYQLRSGDARTVTHRVVGLTWSPEGEQWFTTRGDANAAVDPEPVRPEQVRGEVWYSVPWLGHVSTLATSEQRTVVTRALAGGLFVYAVLVVLLARRRSSGVPGGTAEGTTEHGAEPVVPREEHLQLPLASGRHG